MYRILSGTRQHHDQPACAHARIQLLGSQGAAAERSRYTGHWIRHQTLSSMENPRMAQTFDRLSLQFRRRVCQRPVPWKALWTRCQGGRCRWCRLPVSERHCLFYSQWAESRESIHWLQIPRVSCHWLHRTLQRLCQLWTRGLFVWCSKSKRSSICTKTLIRTSTCVWWTH